MTPEAARTISELRHGGHFEWYVVDVIAFVLYAYSSAIRRGEWGKVVLALGFWAAEFLWEMFNALVLHFSARAALWTVTGKSAFVIYVGLNIEISMMFAVAPLVVISLLPEKRDARIIGLPSRVVVPAAVGLFCVAVECVLNRVGLLEWSWWFWRWPMVGLIVVAYSAPFVALVWAHERWSVRTKERFAAGTIALAVVCHYVLGVRLQWI